MRVYGPIPSRRFGLSLGIDVVPMKRCTFDCIYCQLGGEFPCVVHPESYYPVTQVIKDVTEAIERGPRPDVLTLAGSGEPTLYADLGLLFDELGRCFDIPTLLITNSSLLHIETVAEAALKADILAPSLDAGDEATFRVINRPYKGFNFEKMLDGLEKVTHAHKGEVHLEVMLIDGINDDEQSLYAIAERLKKLRFDRIDINTPVRPPMPERGAMPCDEETLKRAQAIFGPKAHPIADFVRRRSVVPSTRSFSDTDKDIREMLMRRPLTRVDIIESLGIPKQFVDGALEQLQGVGLIEARSTGSGTYYHVVSQNPGLTKKSDVSPLE